jgi:hypothetical protein
LELAAAGVLYWEVRLTNPGNCGNPRAKAGNEDDDNDDQQHTRPANVVTLDFEGF